MRTFEEYMALPYRMEIVPDPDEGGYVVSFPELSGCLSVGGTIDEAVQNAADAKAEWLAVALEEGVDIPEPQSSESYSGRFKLRIPKSLHRQLAAAAKQEGISMNQYCLYLLAQNNALHAHPH